MEVVLPGGGDIGGVGIGDDIGGGGDDDSGGWLDLWMDELYYLVLWFQDLQWLDISYDDSENIRVFHANMFSTKQALRCDILLQIWNYELSLIHISEPTRPY